MCIKNCIGAAIACHKKAFENIGCFFKQEHTPLEKGLMVSTALLGGIVLGFACAPEKSVQVGSCNGCGNNIESLEKPHKYSK